jgi:hypothetical protein
VASDREQLEGLVEAFFRAFTSGPDAVARLDALRAMFLPSAVIVRTCGTDPAVYDVDGFIAPRAKMLSDGTLVDFTEWPVDGRLDIYGDIAQWFGTYAKSGRQDGVAIDGRGMKSIQFVRTAQGWQISAAAWDDERP